MTIDLSQDKRWRPAASMVLAAIASALALAALLIASLPAWLRRLWQARRDGAILDLAEHELDSGLASGLAYAAAARKAADALRRRWPALSEPIARSYLPSERALAERREAVGDRAGAIALYRGSAARADRIAQWRLGELLADSAEGDADRAAAEGWLRAAAQGGKPEAQLRLATLLDAPGAPEAARAEAISWLRAAADRDHPAGQRELGRRLESDPATLARAVRLYRAAAEGGDRPAQLALAALYESGRGVAKDPVAACAWYAIAAEDPLKVGDLPEAARRRDALAARLDPKDRALALKAARRWAPRKD